MELIGLALASVIGLSLGLLGGGGSILTVPVFVYVLDFAAKPAIAASLPVVGATSLAGAIGHWRAGNVHLRAALAFGAIAMAGAYGGARLAVFLAGGVQLALLAIVMLAAAVAMLRRAGAGSRGSPTSRASRRGLGAVLLVGLGVGVLTGLVGIGGGFLVVPALVVLGKLPMKQAVGTSLLVIAMNSASGFLGYAGQVDLPWTYLSLFIALAIGGILAGAYLTRFVSHDALRRAFALFLLVVGALMLYQNRGAFAARNRATAAVGRSA